MALYVLKWIVGVIVLAVGVLFGLSIALNAKSADMYMMSWSDNDRYILYYSWNKHIFHGNFGNEKDEGNKKG